MRPKPAAAALAFALALAGLPAGAAPRDPADLLNIALSPELASWLIGAHARMASDDETEEYLRLERDEDALAFIERFWAARDPDTEVPGNSARQAAEEREIEADRRFGEAGIAGRRTDRGTIWVLYGEPESTTHEPSPLYGEPPLEIWRYPAGAPRGLDGERPDQVYRFFKRKELTVFYRPGRPGRAPDRPRGGGLG